MYGFFQNHTLVFEFNFCAFFWVIKWWQSSRRLWDVHWRLFLLVQMFIHGNRPFKTLQTRRLLFQIDLHRIMYLKILNCFKKNRPVGNRTSVPSTVFHMQTLILILPRNRNTRILCYDIFGPSHDLFHLMTSWYDKVFLCARERGKEGKTNEMLEWLFEIYYCMILARKYRNTILLWRWAKIDART